MLFANRFGGKRGVALEEEAGDVVLDGGKIGFGDLRRDALESPRRGVVDGVDQPVGSALGISVEEELIALVPVEVAEPPPRARIRFA